MWVFRPSFCTASFLVGSKYNLYPFRTFHPPTSFCTHRATQMPLDRLGCCPSLSRSYIRPHERALAALIFPTYGCDRAAPRHPRLLRVPSSHRQAPCWPLPDCLHRWLICGQGRGREGCKRERGESEAGRKGFARRGRVGSMRTHQIWSCEPCSGSLGILCRVPLQGVLCTQATGGAGK